MDRNMDMHAADSDEAPLPLGADDGNVEAKYSETCLRISLGVDDKFGAAWCKNQLGGKTSQVNWTVPAESKGQLKLLGLTLKSRSRSFFFFFFSRSRSLYDLVRMVCFRPLEVSGRLKLKSCRLKEDEEELRRLERDVVRGCVLTCI